MPIAMQYAHDVMSGKVAVCKWVKLAVQRHMDDLKHGHKRGLIFIEEEAQQVIDYFSMLTLYKGDKAGQPFNLQPWQQFRLWCMFGWYIQLPDGNIVRRFKYAYCEIPRKNGKTTESGGLGIYFALADGEAAPEVFFAATKKEQAKIGFNAAVEFVKSTPSLSKRFGVGKGREAHSIYFHGHPGFIKPLSSDEKQSGHDIHAALIDELHELRNAVVFDLLRSGTSARMNPMITMITTAGPKPDGLCWEQREHTCKVLEGIFKDDRWFGIIYTIDDGDDPFDPATWFKANPNLGVSKELQHMQQESMMAKNSAGYLNAFLRLDLNVWTNTDTAWIGDHDWMACSTKYTDEVFANCDTWAGLDLAPIRDFSSLALIAKGKDDKFYTRFYYWIPEDNLLELQSKGKYNYMQWLQQGHLFVTPGNINDYTLIEKHIIELCQKYQVKNIAYDKFSATQLANNLITAGVKMTEYSQAILSMSPPTKELEKYIVSNQLCHHADPVTRWMLSNVVIWIDPNDNIKIRKGPKTDKIDGIIAMVMAIGQRMTDTFVPAKKKSYYDNDNFTT